MNRLALPRVSSRRSLRLRRRLLFCPRVGQCRDGFALLAVACRLHRRLAAGVDRREVETALGNQPFGQSFGAVPRGQVECGGAAGGAGVDVGLVGQQYVGHRDGPHHDLGAVYLESPYFSAVGIASAIANSDSALRACSTHKCSGVKPSLSLTFGVGLLVQKGCDDRLGFALDSGVEGRLAACVAGVHIGAGCDQEISDLRAVEDRRAVQRASSASPLASTRSPFLSSSLTTSTCPPDEAQLERGPALRVADLHVGVAVDQELGQLQFAADCSPVDRGAAEWIFRVDVAVLAVEFRLLDLEPAAVDRFDQRRVGT